MHVFLLLSQTKKFEVELFATHGLQNDSFLMKLFDTQVLVMNNEGNLLHQYILDLRDLPKYYCVPFMFYQK